MNIGVSSVGNKIYIEADTSEAVPNFKEWISTLTKCYKC